MTGVCVVTGGSRGIGRATCLEAARRGYDVVVAYRASTDAGTEVARGAEDLGARAITVEGDLGKRSTIDLIAEVARSLGDVRLLVNNAGITNSGSFMEMTEELWDQAVAINLDAPTWLSKAFAVDLRATHGSIINVSSTGALTGSLHSVPYGATKAALIGLTKTLARMLAPEVCVNAVCPGLIETDLLQGVTQEVLDRICEETPLGRLGTADEVARAILDVSEWRYCTGQTIVVDGGRVLH